MQARFDLAQAALEVSISADACADPHAFDALVAPAFAWLAADVHLIISVRVASAGPRLQIAYGRSSPAWEARYLAAGHDQRDPLLQHLLSSSDLLDWSDLADRGDLSSAQQAVIDDGKAVGFEEAIIAPVHQPGGGATGVLLLGRELDARDPRRRQAARTLSDAYLRNARRLGLTRRSGDPRPQLTQRETEVLYRIHRGQSDKAVALALRLSPHTVTGYVRSARVKLGAAGRVAAARMASELELLPAFLP